MRLNFTGKLVNEPEITAGFIGCGSHAFRNLYPVLQFAPVNLVATCDIDLRKAQKFAAEFGAEHAYADYREMLEKEQIDAVFICTGYDDHGRPVYPELTVDCLNAGCHVWIEKPPAASCAEIEKMQAAAAHSGKNVLVGFKKMFFPANEKARELMAAEGFGAPSLATLQYPQYMPAKHEFKEYMEDYISNRVTGFLDHLCHPVSLMLFLLGMPTSVYYQRSDTGAGTALFRFDSGSMATLNFMFGAPCNCGMERTTILSDSGHLITVENNIRVTYHQMPMLGYGDVPDFYTGTTDQVSAVWEPEFSLGQLYNKGLFLLGYYNEINEFTRAVLEKRTPQKGTLDQAWQATRIFEAFAAGPGIETPLR